MIQQTSEHRGHSGKDGYAVGRDRVQHGLRREALHENHGGSYQQRREEGAVQPEGVRERQRSQDHVVRLKVQHGARPRVESQIEGARRELGALRLSGAARRVEDERTRRTRCRDLCSPGASLHFRFPHDERGPQVRQDGVGLLRCEQRIERGNGRVERESGQHGHDEVRTVRKGHRETPPGREPGARECRSPLGHPSGQLTIGDHTPGADEGGVSVAAPRRRRQPLADTLAHAARGEGVQALRRRSP